MKTPDTTRKEETEKRRQEVYKEYGIDKPPPGQEAWWAFVERADLDRLLKVMEKVDAPDLIREETLLSEARRALRSVIRVRGLTLTQEQDEHIERCEELHELRDWLDRTVTATSMKEVFRWFEDNPRARR